MQFTRGRREEVLEKHLLAENSHDIDAIMSTFAEDAVVLWGGKPYRGRDAIRRLHEGMGFGDDGAFSNLTIVEIRRHTTEQTIIIEQELRGRHTGTWEGVGATGRSVTVPVCTVYEFGDNGLIVSERPHLDRWVIWKQIGGTR
jgi:hypothetical protein